MWLGVIKRAQHVELLAPQAWRPKFDLYSPCKGEMRKTGAQLSSDLHTCAMSCLWSHSHSTCTDTHNNKDFLKKFFPVVLGDEIQGCGHITSSLLFISLQLVLGFVVLLVRLRHG